MTLPIALIPYYCIFYIDICPTFYLLLNKCDMLFSNITELYIRDLYI